MVIPGKQLLNQLQSGKYKNNELVENVVQVHEKFGNAIKIHRHTSEACKYKCHRKTKADASTFCRYAVKPVKHEYIAANVDVRHTDERPEVFIKCGLAKRNRTHENDSMNELQRAQWQYPKDRNDKLTPMSPDIFLLTNSQAKILISDQFLQQKYEANYAAGAEEKARATFEPGQTGYELHIDMENL